MLLAELVACCGEVAATCSRKKKIAAQAACMAAFEPAEVSVGSCYLAGVLPQGRIGLGYATVYRVKPPAAAHGELTVLAVDETLQRIAVAKGKGSAGEKKRLLGQLLASATEPEQAFLRGLLVGEVRQGALEAIVVEALAVAGEVPIASVRRAHMLLGDLGALAKLALLEGQSVLDAVRMQLFRPIQPMLAQPVEGAAAALERHGQVAVEHKLDGARVQAHKRGGEVALYSRRLKEVTAALPEVVEAVAALPADELVLDGEVLALQPDGRPHAFQTTMRRFGRRLDIAAMRQKLPVVPFFFDCLQLDGRMLFDEPAAERYAAMDALLPEPIRIPRHTCDSVEAVDDILDQALAAGHEGVMAKALQSRYAAGKRGADWLKLKPAHTLDLVVLAAEWGHGRRQGYLSNLHLGARNPDGSFTMLGKTFKGMTDKMLAWQTEALSARSLGQEGHVVHVKPELVVEIACNDIQASPHYPGGLALRFARVKRYRTDKAPEDADTLETVKQLFEKSATLKRK